MNMALIRDFQNTIAARVERAPALAEALLDVSATPFLSGEPQTARFIFSGIRKMKRAVCGSPLKNGVADTSRSASASAGARLTRAAIVFWKSLISAMFITSFASSMNGSVYASDIQSTLTRGFFVRVSGVILTSQ